MKDAQVEKLIDWGELLESVCGRPALWVRPMSFLSVLNFIGGYLYAQDLMYPDPQETSYRDSSREWKRFGFWLANKYGYSRNYTWDYLGRYFPNDEEALAAMPKLLAEFRAGNEKLKRRKDFQAEEENAKISYVEIS